MNQAEGNENVRVLVVDDNQSNLVAMRAMLESPAYQLVTASSGREALAHLLNQSFALLILDIRMPDMDGFELARLIKARQKTEHIPILFMSAFYGDEKDVFHGYALGAVDYLTKPARPEVLKAKVNVFVNLYKHHEAEKRQSRQLTHLAGGTPSPAVAANTQWEANYQGLLLTHIRALRLRQAPPSERVLELAREFAAARLRTQDLVRLHIGAVKAITQKLMPTDAENIGLDARLCLLEIIGCLLDLYEEAGRNDDNVGHNAVNLGIDY